MDPAFNSQNDRWIHLGPCQKDPSNLDNTVTEIVDSQRPQFIPRSKKPASLMFLGVVASTGEVCKPIWFSEGFRLNSEDYIEVLRTKVIPWMREVAGNRPFVFQQDSAPAHKAKRTKTFLKQEGIDFWSPKQWPPNSPDSNPLDYAVWSHVQRKACQTRAPNLQILRRRVSAAWRALSQEEIRAFCMRFRSRLQKVVAARGSYFEK